jgi:hypothetical protein
MCYNPVTGKKNFNIVSKYSVVSNYFQQYGTFKGENKVITGTADARSGIANKSCCRKIFNYLDQNNT